MTLMMVRGISTVTMTFAPMQQMLAASKRERFHRVGAVASIETAARGEATRHLSNWVWRMHTIYDASGRRIERQGVAYHALSI